MTSLRHRGVLYGSILGIAVAVALAFATTSVTGFEPGAIVILAILALPFLLGLAPLAVGMSRLVARITWVAAAVVALPLGLLLFWTGAFVVYIPMSLIYVHAAATAVVEPERPEPALANP